MGQWKVRLRLEPGSRRSSSLEWVLGPAPNSLPSASWCPRVWSAFSSHFCPMIADALPGQPPRDKTLVFHSASDFCMAWARTWIELGSGAHAQWCFRMGTDCSIADSWRQHWWFCHSPGSNNPDFRGAEIPVPREDGHWSPVSRAAAVGRGDGFPCASSVLAVVGHTCWGVGEGPGFLQGLHFPDRVSPWRACATLNRT